MDDTPGLHGPVLHSGDVLRRGLRDENLSMAEEMRRGRAQARAAIAPALRTMGKPSQGQATPTSKLVPATKLSPEYLRSVAKRKPTA